MRPKDPVELAAQTLAELRADSHREVPSAQLGIERITGQIGKPWFVWLAAAFVAGWLLLHFGIDRLGFIVSVASLFIAIFILITQNRQNDVAHHRAEVTLQLAVVTEQKVAKIIELIEEVRRDAPQLPNRHDPDADSMAQATDVREAAAELQKAQQRGYE